jgi:hypothetical protein
MSKELKELERLSISPSSQILKEHLSKIDIRLEVGTLNQCFLELVIPPGKKLSMNDFPSEISLDWGKDCYFKGILSGFNQTGFEHVNLQYTCSLSRLTIMSKPPTKNKDTAWQFIKNCLSESGCDLKLGSTSAALESLIDKDPIPAELRDPTLTSWQWLKLLSLYYNFGFCVNYKSSPELVLFEPKISGSAVKIEQVDQSTKFKLHAEPLLLKNPSDHTLLEALMFHRFLGRSEDFKVPEKHNKLAGKLAKEQMHLATICLPLLRPGLHLTHAFEFSNPHSPPVISGPFFLHKLTITAQGHVPIAQAEGTYL